MTTVDDTIIMSKDIQNVVDVESLEPGKTKKKTTKKDQPQHFSNVSLGSLRCDIIFADEEKLRCDVIEYKNTEYDISVSLMLHTQDMTVTVLSNDVVGISLLAGEFEIVDIRCDLDNPNDRPGLTYMAAHHTNNLSTLRDCACITLTFKRDS